MPDLLRLLGKPISDKSVRELVGELGEEPETTTVVDRHYFKFRNHGLSLATDEGMSIETVFAYSDGREGFQGFVGELPNGIQLNWNRERTHENLGAPTKSGGGKDIPLYGVASLWDRYDFSAYSIHIEYQPDEGRGISLVTLSTPEATPGREN